MIEAERIGGRQAPALRWRGQGFYRRRQIFNLAYGLSVLFFSRFLKILKKLRDICRRQIRTERPAKRREEIFKKVS